MTLGTKLRDLGNRRTVNYPVQTDVANYSIVITDRKVTKSCSLSFVTRFVLLDCLVYFDGWEKGQNVLVDFEADVFIVRSTIFDMVVRVTF